MALVESLLFGSKEDADEFVHFLKARKCPARIKIECMLRDEFLLEGRLGGFFELLEELESMQPEEDGDEYTDRSADFFDEDSPFHSGFSHDENDDPGLPISFVLKVMRGDLERFLDYFSDIMGQNQQGDIIFTSDGLNEKLSEIVSSFEAGDKEIPRHLYVDYLRELNYMRCLEQNMLIEESPAGVVLTKRIDPADLIITRLPTTRYEEDEKMINPHGLRHLLNTYYDTLYSVMIDPKLHVIFTPGEISEALANLSVDEESRDDLLVHMSRKQHLLHVLLGVIRDVKMISVDELVRVLNNYKMDSSGDCERTAFHVSPEYLEDLVEDLRKIRVVQGDNHRIRLTNQTWIIPGK